MSLGATPTEIGTAEYARALLNILDDAGAERQHLHDMQRAVLNILDDLAVEKDTAWASLKEKEVLLKEIHHRVKNNLQVISSLLNLQAQYVSDPAVRAIFNESQTRVLSIAMVHEQLYQDAHLSHVGFGAYVSGLLDNLFHTYDAQGRGIERVVAMEGVALPIDLAIPCGLIVNELATNVLKYAFPAGRSGTLRVSLRRLDQAGRLELVVADDGVGLPAALDPHHTNSLGLDLVFTLAEQLEATVEIGRAGGTSFGFVFSGGGAH